MQEGSLKGMFLVMIRSQTRKAVQAHPSGYSSRISILGSLWFARRTLHCKAPSGLKRVNRRKLSVVWIAICSEDGHLIRRTPADHEKELRRS